MRNQESQLDTRWLGEIQESPLAQDTDLPPFFFPEPDLEPERELGQGMPDPFLLPTPSLSYLQEKNNFIERFIYLQGKTDVPKTYYRFVAISMLSAILQNKVWLELSRNNPLYPNLYIFLVGPSGVGKGQAIGAGMRLLESCGLADYCGVINGALTSAALIDFLSGKNGQIVAGTSRAYLVSSELASSIKWGDQADALVKRMTDLFTGDLSSFSDMTRGGGRKSAGKPCISWLAGSTRKWLTSNLRADAMGGGFMARGLFVEELRKTPKIFLPLSPSDYDEVLVALQLQLVDKVQTLQGQFFLEPDALEFLEEWYMSRVEPTTEAGQASWNRHRELALKVALVLCAGDVETTKRITQDQLYEAISLVEAIKATESTLWTYVSKGGKIEDTEWVAAKIKRAGRVTHASLLNNVSTGRGILSKRLWEIIATLEESGKIQVQRQDRELKNGVRNSGKIIYYWVGSRPTLVTPEEYD